MNVATNFFGNCIIYKTTVILFFSSVSTFLKRFYSNFQKGNLPIDFSSLNFNPSLRNMQSFNVLPE